MNSTESGNTDDGKNGRSIPTNDNDAPPAAAPSSSNNLPFFILETNGLPAQRGVKRTRYNNADANEHTSVDSVQENKQRTRDAQPDNAELPDNINTVLPQDVLPTVFRFLETPDFPTDDGAKKCAEVWFNELRLSNLDESGGSAAARLRQYQPTDWLAAANTGQQTKSCAGAVARDL